MEETKNLAKGKRRKKTYDQGLARKGRRSQFTAANQGDTRIRTGERLDKKWPSV